MSTYLNFYTYPFIKDGMRDVVRKVGLLESDCAEMPAHPSIEPVAIFNTETTPPTMVKSWQSFGAYFGRHPKFPATHIDPSGNICRSNDHSVIMHAPARELKEVRP